MDFEIQRHLENWYIFRYIIYLLYVFILFQVRLRVNDDVTTKLLSSSLLPSATTVTSCKSWQNPNHCEFDLGYPLFFFSSLFYFDINYRHIALSVHDGEGVLDF